MEWIPFVRDKLRGGTTPQVASVGEANAAPSQVGAPAKGPSARARTYKPSDWAGHHDFQYLVAGVSWKLPRQR